MFEKTSEFNKIIDFYQYKNIEIYCLSWIWGVEGDTSGYDTGLYIYLDQVADTLIDLLF